MIEVRKILKIINKSLQNMSNKPEDKLRRIENNEKFDFWSINRDITWKKIIKMWMALASIKSKQEGFKQ